MAARFHVLRLFFNENRTNLTINTKGFVRHGHGMRGKPPGVARNLQQRLDELNYKDPALTYRVDIGFPRASRSRSEELSARLIHRKAKRCDPELEKLARSHELKINLEDVRAEWLKTAGPHQIRKLADHYEVFKHLFGDAYFIPRVVLYVQYLQEDDKLAPVYYGNILKPFEAAKAPEVNFTGDKDALYTLIMTNPDGHLTKDNSEYVHWFIGNISGNDVNSGDTVVPYLQPIPPRGTGFHRHIFILYKQESKLDYSSFKVTNSNDLPSRTFNTLEFYRERQDVLTPGGLSFFQSDWDKSLTDFYHNTLDMKEPVYEYDFPEPYIKPQTWFPLRQPFNLYMDKYRDPKKIHKEYFVKKLKKVHPFKPPPEKLRFPNAHSLDKSVPSWLKLERKKERMGWGRINDIE